MDLLTPRNFPTVHSRYTHTEAVHCQRVFLGFLNLPSLSLTAKGSWIHLWGRVAKPLVSSLTPVPPPPPPTNADKNVASLAEVNDSANVPVLC